MSAASWILNLWPGLPQLWQRGSWQSLVVAVAFSALLNGALWESFAGGLDRSGSLAIGLWAVIVLAVIVGLLWRAFDQSGLEIDETDDDRTETLQLAQTEYLKGHWFEAQKYLGELLSLNANDPEARLLLAATLRRSGRQEAAQKELSRLRNDDLACHWHVEIDHEIKRLASQAEQSDAASENEDEPQTLPFRPKAA